MCQRLNTGGSYNFYFGIFICCGPLMLAESILHFKIELNDLRNYSNTSRKSFCFARLR